MLYTTCVVQFVVFIMLTCMSFGLYVNESGMSYTFARNFSVFFVKLPCTIALHFLLYPEVPNGLSVMKYSNQNPEMFVANGSEIAYTLGFLHVLQVLYCEALNIFLLTYQTTTDYCIIYFVSLKVIMQV